MKTAATTPYEAALELQVKQRDKVIKKQHEQIDKQAEMLRKFDIAMRKLITINEVCDRFDK